MKKLQIFFLTFCCLACSKTELPEFEFDYSPQTRAVPTNDFDWENCDFMPTPPGQSAIPCPWVGAGSIATEFGIDITNDRYRKDGWELIYNTFDADAPGPLNNPYFMLYNKYRGLLRIYLYVTTICHYAIHYTLAQPSRWLTNHFFLPNIHIEIFESTRR